MLKLLFVLVMLVATALAACGGGGLGKSDVENLPPGDATGSAYSGNYAVTGTVESCSGDCVVPIFGEPVDICDNPEFDPNTWVVIQSNGDISLKPEDDEPATGGVNADGSFKAGLYDSDPSDDTEGYILLTGTFSSSGFSALAETRVVNQELDCSVQFDLSGSKM